ncbi:MAG: DUF3098 domain-containing protein [Saprospiraceae bacterium]|nr:DUF3098 domain-containing protein [Saprospiraceae bacterium]
MAKPNKPQQIQPKTAAPAPARPQAAAPKAKADTPSVFGQRNDKLVFGKETYKWMLIGIAIMAVGFILMSGGSMPDPNTWDESIIYSSTRTVVAPFLILSGLGVQIFAIFKKNSTAE